jgi:YEATS domain-containing protein 4
MNVQNGEKRLQGVSLSFPIVLGTVAVSLGKKATDTATHSWTVYARSPVDENLGAVVKKVTFKLHESFPNPHRDVKAPPFELQETGWGEFDLLIELHFHDDVQEPPLELLHSLRLGLDVHGNPQRRPYVHESYEEIVFWEPTVELANRMKAMQGKVGPPSSVAQYFGRFDPEADYQLVQNARKRLAKHHAMLKAKLAMIEQEDGTGGAGAGPGLDREASLFPQQ